MKERKNNRYESMVSELLNRFPEFAKSDARKEVFDEDGPYIFYSYFGDFLLDAIEKEPESDFVQRTFDFINGVFDRKDLSSEVWDLFNIELLERLEMKEEYKKIAKKKLKGKALQAFEEQVGRPE